MQTDRFLRALLLVIRCTEKVRLQSIELFWLGLITDQERYPKLCESKRLLKALRPFNSGEKNFPGYHLAGKNNNYGGFPTLALV